MSTRYVLEEIDVFLNYCASGSYLCPSLLDAVVVLYELDDVTVTMLLVINNVRLKSSLSYTHIPQVVIGDRQHPLLYE